MKELNVFKEKEQKHELSEAGSNGKSVLNINVDFNVDVTFESKYSRMDRVKFVEDSL